MMKKLLWLLPLFWLGLGKIHAQSREDSLLCTYFALKSGDVWVGKEVSRTDQFVHLIEFRLGEADLPVSEIVKETPLFMGDQVKVVTAVGGIYSGKAISISESGLTLLPPLSGEVSFPFSAMESMEILPKNQEDAGNPNATRYLFAPSAIPLSKGTGYYQNAYILLNSTNYGVTNHISIGGGVGIPLFFFVNPKVGFQVGKNLYLAGGAIAGTTFIGENVTVAIPFAAATYGTLENNATLAAGYGMFWFGGDYNHTQYPITTLNGMARISKRLHLVTENWVIPIRREYYDWSTGVPVKRTELQTFVADGLGLRIKAGNQASFDVAPVMILAPDENPIVLPYLDFVYRF